MQRMGTRLSAGSLGCQCLILTLLVCGCAVSPVTNDRLQRFDPNSGYRLRNLESAEDNSDSLLVILTFSGGGTRAASLAYGVLESLRDTPIQWDGTERSLLDEVDLIASVSGGSLTAAYFGLFGERIFEDFPDKVLYRNIQGGLIKQILSPVATVKMASPLFTRTDILASDFDRAVFGKATYGDIIKRGQRPYIIVNATDITQGSRFEFTQDQFDHLYSDLASYRIAHAVAASAAYPGAFPPVTLRNYRREPDYVLPDWARKALDDGDASGFRYRQARSIANYGESERSFIHLTDGGVADNLGLLPVIHMLRQLDSDDAQMRDELLDRARKVLIITVNAEVKAPRLWDMTPTPLGLIDTLFAAGTTPISNFTLAEIEYIRLLIENHRLQNAVADLHGGPEYRHTPDTHFVEVSFDYVSDSAERAALNEIPTSFKLKREEVDRVRAAADGVLRDHAGFQAFLDDVANSAPSADGNALRENADDSR
ncbi:MAG: patatin-like phospholipase family protein [bacterium]|nr:patatin-like phospholipase family protein [bacterium]